MNLATILLLRLTLNKNGITPNVLYLTKEDFSALRNGLGSMRDVALWADTRDGSEDW